MTARGERLELRAGEAEVHLLDVALDHLGAIARRAGERRARRRRVLRLDEQDEPRRRAALSAASRRTSRLPMKPG